MKRIIIAVAGIIALSFSACKTTEANYRTAYEVAKQKQTSTMDSAVNAKLQNEQLPKNLVCDGVTLPVRTLSIGITKNGGGDIKTLKRYNAVTAQFRQLFNAQSMRQRLIECGFDSAFLLHDSRTNYYVVATTTASAQEAFETLDKIKADTTLHLKAPFPYILRPSHLAH